MLQNNNGLFLSRLLGETKRKHCQIITKIIKKIKRRKSKFKKGIHPVTQFVSVSKV